MVVNSYKGTKKKKEKEIVLQSKQLKTKIPTQNVCESNMFVVVGVEDGVRSVRRIERIIKLLNKSMEHLVSF